MDSLFDHTMLPVEAAVAPRRDRTRRQRRNTERRPRQHLDQWPLDGAINVVLFAGMGGACQGLEEAGFPVHVAVNHDAVAIAAHRALNRHTRHLHADIYEVCPYEATGGRPVLILWMSPDCRDHSVAKGGAPRSPRVRSMPWQGCRWVGMLRKRGIGPQVVYLENVREIRGWGPLVAKRDKATGRVLKVDGTVAVPGERVPVQQQQLVRNPKQVGRTYRAWVRHMRMLGARYEDRDLNCADFGIPTSRKRLFGVAVFDERPITWMPPTHAPRTSAAVKAGQLQPYRAAAEIIDWSLPLPSIFDRKKALAAATQKRIAVGMKRFVLDAASPFLIHTTHHGCRPEIDPAAPFPTITGAHRGEMAVVGAAVVPTTHTSDGARVHDGAEPLPVLTAGVKGGELAVMGATVVGAGGRAAQSPPMGVEDPLNTSTTKEDRCVVAATLVGVAHGNDSRSGSRTYDIEDALRTATGSNDQAVIAAHLTRYHGERRPGETRGIEPADPLATQTTENRFGVVGATLAPHVTKFRNNSVGHEVDEPLHTVTCSHSTYHPGAAPPLGVVAAHLEKFNENSRGQSTEAPIDTLMAGAPRFGVVGAFLEEAHGNSTGRDAGEPMPTQTQTPHHSVVGAALVSTANTGTTGRGSYAWPAEEPVRTCTTTGSHAVVGATMVQTGYGERDGQAPRALDVEEPVGTQVAGGAKHGVVGAYMLQHNTGVVGHSMDEGLSTVTAGGRAGMSPQAIGAAYLTEFRGTSADGQPVTDPAGTMCTGGERGGSHHAPTAAFLTEYYGTGGQHQACDAPLNTAPTRDRFAVTGADALVPPLPPEKLERARQVAAFLRDHGVWDDREFVVFGQWIVVDIGMRMLTPREAAAAHELRMPDEIEIDGVRRPLTKTEAMRLVGNSVPKRMAMLLAQANAQHALSAPSQRFAAE